METPKIKSVEEVAEMWTEDDEKDVKTAIKVAVHQDRKQIHTSLVAAVEGDKKSMGMEINISNEYKLGYRQALDDTLTIINSIFKE